jgi:nucleotide-binding universal stress UspA family protein
MSDTITVAAGFDEEFDEIAEQGAVERAAEGTSLAQQAGFDASPLTASGSPREVIIETARDRGAGLVVIGTRGHGGVGSAIFGSVAAGVLHHSLDVPLLVVPPPSSAAK